MRPLLMGHVDHFFSQWTPMLIAWPSGLIWKKRDGTHTSIAIEPICTTNADYYTGFVRSLSVNSFLLLYAPNFLPAFIYNR